MKTEMLTILSLFTENIASRWSSLGVGGTDKEVQDVVHVLSGTGNFVRARFA